MMDSNVRFDPIVASQNLADGFVDYITTTFHIADPVYKAGLKQELQKKDFLTKGPYLDMNGSFRTGRSLRQLMDEGLVSPGFATLEPVAEKERELKLDRPLYLHQEKALLKAKAGNSLIVTTGTGSGKTECFLLPILQSLLEEERQGTLTPGVLAILIYPMNALANDQIKRMRQILKNHPGITFGIYTGNTEQDGAKARGVFRKNYGQDARILPNELLSRDTMRKTPPHILITNYSMLGYMLLRPKDDKVFSSAKLQYIVLDEAHVYKGTTGMETAMLIRRLCARIHPDNKVQFILTSATLGGKEADREIVAFGHQLCGAEFMPQNIIRSEEANPEMNAMQDYPLELFSALADEGKQVSEILKTYSIPDPAPEGDDGEKLYEFLLTSRLFSKLRAASDKPMELAALSRDLELSRQQLLDFLAVCTRAEKGKTALLKARIHFFVRALEGAYMTLGTNKTLILNRQEKSADGKAVFEAALCQDCGRLALVGREEDGYLCQVARKTDSDPKECEYYLLWENAEEEIVFDDEDSDPIEDSEEMDFVVCANCGKISGKGDLRFGNVCDCEKPEYIPVRKVDRTKEKKIARCPACGTGTFRAFYLGSEAATAVLGTELFEQLPSRKVISVERNAAPTGISRFGFALPKAAVQTQEKTPQFLCFSDSRSEAAYFAVYMERSYRRFLRNRGIWMVAKEMEKEGVYSLSVPAFADRLVRIFDVNRTFDHWSMNQDHLDRDSLHQESVANAWVGILSEMVSSRHDTSLTAVGLLHFEYAGEKFEELKEQIIEALPASLSKNDRESLLQQLILDGVYSGAVNCGEKHKLSDEERETIFFTAAEQYLVEQTTASSERYTYGWCARERNEEKYYVNARLRRLTVATGWSEKDTNEFLRELWSVINCKGKTKFAFDVGDFRVCLNSGTGSKTWRCKKCGSVTPYTVENCCAVLKCGGELEVVSPEELQKDNHYVNRYSGENMKLLQMREHTAQLSRDCQTQYQQAFVEGKLNALSCSTTFEMGVDVGGLETVYMRDVPPGPANYVQRAGRAGRSAHTAAYVLTYAKLSSHDFTFYNEPTKVISGKIQAPVFALQNEKVLRRHIFAVAMAEFLASYEEVYAGDDQYYFLNDGGYEKLKAFLETITPRLQCLLKQSVPEDMHQILGVTDGSWRKQLIGEEGVLEQAVQEYRNELAELEKARKKADKEQNLAESAGLAQQIRRFRASPEDRAGKKSLVEFLTRSNVLPKYGFPVDTVELSMGTRSSRDGNGLQLSRDLQMAVAEYAPGAQVIADGKMYTSRYIRKEYSKDSSKGSWEYGYFATCSNCGENNFNNNQLTWKNGANCVSCGEKIGRKYWHKTIEPRLGFIVAEADGKPVPTHRPERDYKTDDYYVGAGDSTVLLSKEFKIGAECVRLQASKNDSLAVVGLGEHIVCPYCGYATDDGASVLPEGHKNSRGYLCAYRSEGKAPVVYRLSHIFKTDVAAITFWTADATDYGTMVSVLYAILEGLSKELDIERTDIKGCLHRVKWAGSGLPIYSLILYDAVAGGAGHVRRIVTEGGEVFEQVLRRAFRIVNECRCEPSCYSCIRNYYNQKIHDQLDRRKAAEFLKKWLGHCETVAEEVETAEVAPVVDISGGESAENYRSWKQLFESNCFGEDCAALDKADVERKGWLVMPDMTLDEQQLSPYLVSADHKTALFDELDSEIAAKLAEQGWTVQDMEEGIAHLAGLVLEGV